MRTFVAIDIPAEVRRRISELIEILQRTGAPVRWARVDGLHITLKFIGELSPRRVEGIQTVLRSIHLEEPLAIGVQEAGFFPSETPRVIWLGIHAGAGLAELVRRMEDSFAGLGIARENRPFAPHLTIGRLEVSDEIPAVRELLRQRQPLDLGSFTATEFFLYESKLGRGGSVYTKIARYPLAPTPAGNL